jgi:hypothetical protein
LRRRPTLSQDRIAPWSWRSPRWLFRPAVSQQNDTPQTRTPLELTARHPIRPLCRGLTRHPRLGGAASARGSRPRETGISHQDDRLSAEERRLGLYRRWAQPLAGNPSPRCGSSLPVGTGERFRGVPISRDSRRRCASENYRREYRRTIGCARRFEVSATSGQTFRLACAFSRSRQPNVQPVDSRTAGMAPNPARANLRSRPIAPRAVKSQHHRLILIGGIVERCALSIRTKSASRK